VLSGLGGLKIKGYDLKYGCRTLLHLVYSIRLTAHFLLVYLFFGAEILMVPEPKNEEIS
jgi:hypothetical protein